MEATVASSNRSATLLAELGLPVADLNSVGPLDVYVDGTDEANSHLHLIKGGGAALTREKIVAAAAREFICIADVSKKVSVLGVFPLPVEVIPMARSQVARALAALGGQPVWREGVITDNHNLILDVHGMVIEDPLAMETRINQITGVVCNGLFAARPADVLLCRAQDIDTAGASGAGRGALDVGIVCPQAATHLAAAAEPLGAAEGYVRTKCERGDVERRCRDAGVVFQPLIFESTGGYP